ncbi:hypothetical protein AU15_17300 [Marinobacter salarius]|jgi:hypothetical protein|uniref:DUF2931 family protein n=1 Tax=Marinobacter salarius TaxID=1420917 RepID=W5YTB6_9GAMM|nr:DUF2931 family protein [Marinobacter salarius]AHI32356.1 hypothetical protein AU15_17300 [Marinobacter salarius]
MIRKISVAWVLVLAVLASGCASPQDNDSIWYIDVAAPEHYDVWGVEMFLEKTGERSWRQPVGYVGCCWEGPNGPTGSGSRVDPFPELIWIRWFSFAEQKYYVKLIEVPPNLLERMRKPAPYATQIDMRSGPRDTMVIGLAPGGTVVVWILNQIGNEIEVMRMKATEVPGDPDDFEVGTRNYLEKHGDYLQEHGIPTEGW